MSPKGRPFIIAKTDRLSPPPERTCPICFRKMTLIDKRRGHERWACPKHGEPGVAA